ncbi:SDR family NAD(P)-dependent oxidoreductase [Deltaproteobacteria bacterium TL4]
MVGITSYGAHIPRLRLDRMSVFKQMGWLTPAIMMVAQGERSMCNWDEDSMTMAVEASRDCLIGKNKRTLDAVFLASTTLPFADRQNAGMVAAALNLNNNIVTSDYTSSLKSGTTALVTALDIVKGGAKHNILVTAADSRKTRAAYFYEMWFGDGAASLTVGDTDVIAEFKGSYSISYDFVDHYRGSKNNFDYVWEERWVRDEGYSKIIPEAILGLMNKLNITMNDVDKLIFPCFFKSEHKAIAKQLGATGEKVVDNMHEVCGETGAAHSLLMFIKALEDSKPGDKILMASFGQGCDALYFEVTDNILNLSSRNGVNGSLKHKKTTDNYQRFLKFNELVETEMGIRSEAETQTAMTVLWRKNKMLMGLVGGFCKACNSPQFPSADICVNPDCGTVQKQEDYEFADVPATVKTFTGDLLTVSVDPPHKYGMVQFEGGGRMLANFTDCELEDLKVGLPMKMVFRRRFEDKTRGFINYFWSAMPIPGAKVVEVLDPVRFDGQVAIITGAGAGLGKVYALELAKRGAKVVVNDLGGSRDGSGDGNSSAADQVVQEIKALGGEAVANYDSVATPEGGANIVKTAVNAFGRVDILINNAGILRDKTFLKMEPEHWQPVLDVHLNGAYHVTQPAFQLMKDQGYGRIVMTTSGAGLYGNFGQTNYSSAKMALVGLMNTLKLEGGKNNVMVNTVAPIAASRLTEDVLPPDLFEKCKPECVAPIVLYFSSKECQESGTISNVGMGYFNRAAYLTGPGIKLGSVDKPPTIEDIHQNWKAINSLEGAKEMNDAMAALMELINPPSPKVSAESASSAGGGAAYTVKGVFAVMASTLDPAAAAGVNVIFQYIISGPTGGEWNVTVKDQTCTVAKGLAESPTCTLKIGDEDFLKLTAGELDPMQAFTTGKLKIEGDIMKSQLIAQLFTKKPEGAPSAGGSAGSGSAVESLFNQMPEHFNSKAANGVNVVFQYKVSGLTGGDWNVTVKDQKCSVQKGLADAPTCTLIIADEDFLKLLKGELDPMQAFTTGKLKIEGDIMKSQLINQLFNI